MKTLTSIFQLFPYVLSSVIAIEQTIQAPGATKKQILLDAIGAVAKIGESVPNPIVAIISAMADVTVASLNKAGVFTHATATTTPAA